jgi:hypothetical protein
MAAGRQAAWLIKSAVGRNGAVGLTEALDGGVAQRVALRYGHVGMAALQMSPIGGEMDKCGARWLSTARPSAFMVGRRPQLRTRREKKS